MIFCVEFTRYNSDNVKEFGEIVKWPVVVDVAEKRLQR